MWLFVTVYELMCVILWKCICVKVCDCNNDICVKVCESVNVLIKIAWLRQAVMCLNVWLCVAVYA